MPATAPHAQSASRGHDLGVCSDMAGQSMPAGADTLWTQASLCRVKPRQRSEVVGVPSMTHAPIWQGLNDEDDCATPTAVCSASTTRSLIFVSAGA